MARVETYSYGQGRVYLANRTPEGVVGVQRWIGDVSAISVKFTVDDFSHKESYSGQRLEVRKIITSREGEVSMTLHEFSRENLALALLGTDSEIQAGTVTGEALPSEIKASDRVALKYPNVSNVVINSLTANTDYIVDETFGAIEFLKPQTSFTQTVSYSYGKVDNVAMMTVNSTDLFLRFEGVNLAEDNEWNLVELYKVNFNPTETLDLINNEDSLGSLPLTGKVLADTSKANDKVFGRFGRTMRIKK